MEIKCRTVVQYFQHGSTARVERYDTARLPMFNSLTVILQPNAAAGWVSHKLKLVCLVGGLTTLTLDVLDGNITAFILLIIMSSGELIRAHQTQALPRSRSRRGRDP